MVFVSLAEKFGCVTKTTDNVEEVLGYSQSFLTGKNIKIIIPDFVADVHDDILRNYIKKSTNR